MKNLTQLQNKFITEYIKSLDAELSAKRAGYKSKDLKSVAENLLCNNSVVKEIKSRIKDEISSLRVNKGYVIQKFLEIAEFSLEEEDILDKDGGFTGKKKLRDTAAGLRALEALCKHAGFNTQENDANDGKIIKINNLDENKI